MPPKTKVFVSKAHYIVVKGNKILRAWDAYGAEAAKAILKPDLKKGEILYIKVGE